MTDEPGPPPPYGPPPGQPPPWGDGPATPPAATPQYGPPPGAPPGYGPPGAPPGAPPGYGPPGAPPGYGPPPPGAPPGYGPPPGFGPPGFGPPGFGPPGYGPPGAPPTQGTSGLATAALVTGILLGPVGVVLGIIALRRIKRTREGGRGLAIAGIVIGALSTVLSVIFIVVALTRQGSVDAGDVERRVESAQKEKSPDVRVGKATCPSDLKAKTGSSVRCTIPVGEATAPYDVTVTSVEGGTVRYSIRVASPLLDLSKLEGNLAQQAGAGVTADCRKGGPRIVVSSIGAMLTCTLSDGSQTQDITVAVKDLDGTVTIVGK